MTALVLAALLNLSPGIQLADNVESRHVALSQARLPLVFVARELRPSIDAMTREQLAAELRRLDETRPSIVGPIVLTSVGAVLGIPGAAMIVIGLGNLASGSGYVEVLLVVGGVMLAITGTVLLLVGAIMLAVRLARRGGHAEDVDEVQKRIDVLDQVPPAPVARAWDAAPPPPYANLVVPGGLRTVMTF